MRITKTTVTPSYDCFRRSELDTEADSAKRILLCERVVQGRSKTRHLKPPARLSSSTRLASLAHLSLTMVSKAVSLNAGANTLVVQSIPQLSKSPSEPREKPLLEMPAVDFFDEECKFRDMIGPKWGFAFIGENPKPEPEPAPNSLTTCFRDDSSLITVLIFPSSIPATTPTPSPNPTAHVIPGLAKSTVSTGPRTISRRSQKVTEPEEDVVRRRVSSEGKRTRELTEPELELKKGFER